MYDKSKDQDVIVIELGRELSETQYKAVVDSVVKFLNKRWPNQQYRIPS